jgi:hypothetical protein
LVQQRADLRGIVDVVRRQRSGEDIASVGFYADMQLAPRPAGFNAVLLDQPFTRAAQPQPGAVDQQM